MQLTQADCTSGVGDRYFGYPPVSVGEGRKACASAVAPPGQRILTVSCSSMTVPLQRPLAQSVQLLLFCGVGQDEILGCHHQTVFSSGISVLPLVWRARKLLPCALKSSAIPTGV